MVWMLALAAAQGLSSASQQKQAADAANRARKRYERLNTMFANEALLQNYTALAARRGQERKQLFDTLDQVTLDATRRIGSASVASGESGLHGKTAAALINDFKIQQLKSETNIMDTEKYMQEQYARDIEAARSQATSRILGGQQERAPQPNYGAIFLNAFTSYMQMQSMYNKANPKVNLPSQSQSSGYINTHSPGYTPPGSQYIPGGGVNAPVI